MTKGIHDQRYRRLLVALKDARVRSKISQAALADRLGQRQQFVSKYESGERRLDVFEFIDIANTLDIPWADIAAECALSE